MKFDLVDFEIYHNTLANKETPPHDCNRFRDSEKHNLLLHLNMILATKPLKEN